MTCLPPSDVECSWCEEQIPLHVEISAELAAAPPGMTDAGKAVVTCPKCGMRTGVALSAWKLKGDAFAFWTVLTERIQEERVLVPPPVPPTQIEQVKMDKLGPFRFGRVYNMDCRKGLPQIPNGSVHMVLSDPPYGISWGDGDLSSCIEVVLGHAAPENNPDRTIANDDYESFKSVLLFFLDQTARVLSKDSAVCCCCCGGGGGPRPVFADVAKWMDERLSFDQAVVWSKGGEIRGGMSGGGLGWRYRRNYEFVMVAHRKGGRMRWFDQSSAISNVISIPRIIPKADEHSTPKPLSLMELFLKLHTQPGDIVIDPFSGGGTTGVACERLGRRFVGFEIDPHWAEYGNKRIEAERVALGQKDAATAAKDQQLGLLPPSMRRQQIGLGLPEDPEPQPTLVQGDGPT